MDSVYPLLRFVHYGLLLGLFGLTAFPSFGLRQIWLHSGKPPLGFGALAGATAALVATVALVLVSIADMMAQPVSQLERATIEAIILSTDPGWAFLVRTGFLMAAVATLILFRRPARAYAIASIWFGLAIATLPWSGHAAAYDGLLGAAHRANDAVHLLAAGLWLGAIGWFLFLTIAAHRQRIICTVPLLADMHKFAPLGMFLVAVVAVTGAINAQLIFGIENSFKVVQTDYGWLLAAKILLVCVMLFFGAGNARIARRPASSDNRKINLAKLRASLGAELILAILVIGLTAFIGMNSPMSD